MLVRYQMTRSRQRHNMAADYMRPSGYVWIVRSYPVCLHVLSTPLWCRFLSVWGCISIMITSNVIKTMRFLSGYFLIVFFYLKIGSKVSYVYPIFEWKCQFQTQTAWYIWNHGYPHLSAMKVFLLAVLAESYSSRQWELCTHTHIYHSRGPNRKVPTAILRSSLRGSPCICATG